MIDLVLAGDNAVVIGLAAAGLPREQRARAILVGIIAATVLRIMFAAFAIELLDDRRPAARRRHSAAVGVLEDVARIARARARRNCEAALTARGRARARARRFAQAAWQIVMADISMSLDNVLAVAGAARDHPAALVFGLGLSIVLMGVAASFIARLLNRHRWIAYVGLAIILYVALDMIWRGAHEV